LGFQEIGKGDGDEDKDNRHHHQEFNESESGSIPTEPVKDSRIRGRDGETAKRSWGAGRHEHFQAILF
jgi:hypothetical protein